MRKPAEELAATAPVITGLGSGPGLAERALAVTMALGGAMTTDEVARVAVAAGVAELGAVAGLFAVGSAGAEDIVVVASQGYPTTPPPAPEQKLLRDAIRTGAPVLVADAAERARSDPHLERWRAAIGYEAVAILPLLVDGRALGAVVFHFPERRVFAMEERAFLGAFAGWCAQAFERARLYDAETAARREAEAARAEAEHLFRLTAGIAQAQTLGEVHERALEAVTGALHLERAAILLIDPDGVLRFKAWRGLSDVYRQTVEGHSPWSADTMSPPPIVVPDVVLEPSLSGFASAFAAEGIRALAFVPLVHEQRVLGKFVLYHDAPRVLVERELRFATTIAGQTAQAVARARLLEVERRLRTEAEDARERAAFIARVGFLLASTVDVEKTLHDIARLAVPDRADGLAIEVIDAEGHALSVTVPPPPPTARGWPTVLFAARDAVLLTGHPELIDSRRDRHDAGDSGDLASALEALGVQAAIIAPVRARESALGTISLVATRPARRFGPAEVDLAVQIGRRIGVALEGARLYAAERRARSAAEKSAERLSRLQALTGALSAALTLDEVAAVVVELGGLSLSAHTSALWVHDDAANALELVRAWGAGRAAADARPRVALDTANALTEAFRTGQPTYFESREAIAARYPQLAAAEPADESGVTSPLVASARVHGVLAFGFRAARRFTADDRIFIEVLAQNAAQALERARLYQVERHAREGAARLQRVTAAFSRALTPDEVADVAVGLAGEVLGTDRAALATLTEDGAAFAIVRAVGEVGTSALRTGHRIAAGGGGWQGGLATAIQLVTPVYTERTESGGRQASLPLISRERVIGALRFGFPRGDRFEAVERAFLEALASACAQALERARLYAEERSARVAAEHAGARLRLLAESSARLTSLDWEATVQSAVSSALGSFADWSMLDLIDADGSMRRVAVSHADATTAAAAARLESLPPRAEGPIRQALAERRTLLVSVTEPRNEHEHLATQLGAASIIFAPLVMRGQALGVLTFGRGPAWPGYGDDDLAVAEELARRAAMALENTRLYEQAVNAVGVRDEFLAIAGHELRTPLTPILFQAELLGRVTADTPMAKVRERAEKLVRNAERLARLVDELLDVSRITAGRLTLDPEELDLADAVREVAARMADDCARARVELRIDVVPAIGRWDRLRVEQVVGNLLGNAIKYGAGKPVEVTLTAGGGHARLVVRDHGIGIAPSDQARIFQRFERAVPSRHFGGLGLGLWIVRQVVEAHGGTIALRSLHGEGAEFTVELPMVDA